MFGIDLKYIYIYIYTGEEKKIQTPKEHSGEKSVTLHPGLSSIQLLSRVWLFATPWTAARPVSLSITNHHPCLPNSNSPPNLQLPSLQQSWSQFSHPRPKVDLCIS